MSVQERREAEIELLQAMYPDQIEWSCKIGDIKYASSGRATLTLRLPETYPVTGLPAVVSAVDPQKVDIRQKVQQTIAQLHLSEGEEILDSVFLAYDDLLKTLHQQDGLSKPRHPSDDQSATPDRHKVTIVWLHHLLATSKRKLALNPTLDAQSISGLTKPGYPGILLFWGPIDSVNAHVAELKDQRWQAFQVRFEEEYPENDTNKHWKFEHGKGIQEVETMSEAVQSIIGTDKREAFLRAVGVK